MAHKPSIRNLAATAAEAITFSEAVQKSSVSEAVKKAIAGIAEGLACAINASHKTHQNVTTPNLHATWSNAQAADLISPLTRMKACLEANSPALRGIVANDLGSEISRITSLKLVNSIGSHLQAERLGTSRDPGAYWQNPLARIAETLRLQAA